jgi:hypothetical protein
MSKNIFRKNDPKSLQAALVNNAADTLLIKKFNDLLDLLYDKCQYFTAKESNTEIDFYFRFEIPSDSTVHANILDRFAAVESQSNPNILRVTRSIFDSQLLITVPKLGPNKQERSAVEDLAKYLATQINFKFMKEHITDSLGQFAQLVLTRPVPACKF